MAKIVKPKHGGRRIGAGRKSTLRDPAKKLRPIWCWTTEDEKQLINKSLTADERTAILLKSIGVNLP